MLDTYLTDTRNLLQLPTAPSTLYTTANVTRWINIARGQTAGEGECIRILGTIDTVVGQRAYSFSTINLGVSAANGVAGAIHVRDILFGLGSGYRKLTPRPWEWFQQYKLNNVVPASSAPVTWAQYGQGAAAPASGSNASGTFYIDPLPDAVYTLTCDCVCYPTPLVDDSTVEPIPYLWTDAVPFFAAYYALLSAQLTARQADAERYFGQYQTFLQRARTLANPSVLRWQYQQASDPTQANKIGIRQAAQGGGG